MKQIIDAVYSEYMDKALQVTVERGAPDNSTGNGLLHAGLFYTWLGANGALMPHDIGLFATMCYRSQVEPGLFHRSPWKTNEWQSHDDYLGLLGAGYFCRSKVTAEIVSYGRRHFWCWDNLVPGRWTIKKWFARFPDFVPFAKMCNRELVFFGAVLVALKIWWSAGSPQGDTNMRVYIIGQVARERSWLCELAFEYWKRKSIPYPFKPYFGEGHPFSSIDF